LLSEAHLASLPAPVAPPHAAPPFRGLRIDVARSESSVAEALSTARLNGVDFVELRANRRPGQFERGESHVASGPIAGAAAAAQAAGLVPVLSIAMPGLEASTIGLTRAVTVNALSSLFEATSARDVDPARLIVRMNLVTPGPRAELESSAEAVARFTLDSLDEGLPAEVPAVWFLSSGRSLTTLCRELEAITALASARDRTLRLGYAMGRALVESALDGMISGGVARAHQRLGAACDALHRSLVPALAGR